MNKQELKQEIDKIEKYCNDEKIIIYKKYICDNNPVNIGDIVTDHYHTLKVESIKYHICGDGSCAIYYGAELNKDGSIRKQKRSDHLYQLNMKFINDKPYKFKSE